MMTTQQEIYQIFHIIKFIINLLVQIYQDEQIYHNLLAQIYQDTGIPQQIYFSEKLEEDEGGVMGFFAEKQQKTVLKFSLNSLIVSE